MTVLASKERYFILPLASKNLNVCVMGKQLQELGKNVYDALYVTEKHADIVFRNQNRTSKIFIEILYTINSNGIVNYHKVKQLVS